MQNDVKSCHSNIIHVIVYTNESRCLQNSCLIKHKAYLMSAKQSSNSTCLSNATFIFKNESKCTNKLQQRNERGTKKDDNKMCYFSKTHHNNELIKSEYTLDIPAYYLFFFASLMLIYDFSKNKVSHIM